jgi:hypothetical protein
MKGDVSSLAVQAACAMAARDGAPILSNDAPVIVPDDRRKFRRDTSTSSPIPYASLLLFRSSYHSTINVMDESDARAAWDG